MAISTFSGPLATFYDGTSNPDQGPSLFCEGTGLLDPRSQFSNFQGPPLTGWGGNAYQLVIDQVPSQLQPDNISASASPGSGAIVLVSSSGAGITVGASVKNALTGQLV